MTKYAYDIKPIVPRNFDRGLLLVGEAPGYEEMLAQRPFAPKGMAAKELRGALSEANVNPKECAVTNVFLNRPTRRSNNIMFYFADEEHEEVTGLPTYQGKYLKPKGFEHYSILQLTILLLRPRVVVAMGRTAMWFFLEQDIPRVTPWVGTTTDYLGSRVFLTWHPSYTMRTPSAHEDLVQDLGNAQRHLETLRNTG